MNDIEDTIREMKEELSRVGNELHAAEIDRHRFAKEYAEHREKNVEHREKTKTAVLEVKFWVFATALGLMIGSYKISKDNTATLLRMLPHVSPTQAEKVK